MIDQTHPQSQNFYLFKKFLLNFYFLGFSLDFFLLLHFPKFINQTYFPLRINRFLLNFFIISYHHLKFLQILHHTHLLQRFNQQTFNISFLFSFLKSALCSCPNYPYQYLNNLWKEAYINYLEQWEHIYLQVIVFLRL